MKLTFYRHGQTEGNLQGRYIGHIDQPLCEAGRAAARAVGSDPTVLRVVTSPLLRTLQTAKILFPNALPEALPGLAEMDFGVFEGKNYLELDGDPAYQAWVDSGCAAACPDGEDQFGFIRRTCAAFERVVNRALREGDTELYFVVHSGTIMALMSCYAHPCRPYFDWKLPNCGALHVYLEEELWRAKEKFFVLGEAE